MSLAVTLLKWLGKPFAALLKWLFADWRHIVIAVLTIDLANQAFRVAPRLRSEIQHRADERDAARGTIANLQEAARQAAIRQQANIVRVDAVHDAINRENVSALHSEVAALRYRSELLSGRLRAAQAAAPAGSADGAGLPGTIPAGTRIAETAGDQGFPEGAGAACPVASGMTISERLIASEQAYQLDRLIDAVEAAANVNTSPEPQP
jgi:hypothetical protein